MTREEIAARFPEAAAFALELRELFGADARLTWVRNTQGEEIGRRCSGLTVLAQLLVTLEAAKSKRAPERDTWIPSWRADRRARLWSGSSPGAPAP